MTTNKIRLNQPFATPIIIATAVTNLTSNQQPTNNKQLKY